MIKNIKIGAVFVILTILFVPRYGTAAIPGCDCLFPFIDEKIGKYGKYGYIDRSGKIVVPARFDIAYEFFDGVGVVKINEDTFGFVDSRGKVVVFPDTYLLSSFYENVAVGNFRGRYGVINKAGKPIAFFDFPVESSEYRPASTQFSDGLAPLPILNGGTAFVDTSGRTVLVLDSADRTSGFIDGMARIVDSDAKAGIIDKKGNFLIAPIDPKISSVLEPSDGLVKLGKHQFVPPDVPNWKYYNREGKLEFEVPYDYAGDFKFGMAPVELNNKWGYMNRKGHIAIPAGFESADDFSEGLAAVKMGGRFGFIDKIGKFVIPPQFGDVKSPFRCGLAYVTSENLGGYINKKGEWVWRRKL